ncbi:MAG: hypothetical protein WAQ25_01310 [Candidatus Saccharimonas sp.]
MVGYYADATLYNFQIDASVPPSGRGLRTFEQAFLHYDINHYRNIVTEGYTKNNVAFFPLFPLLASVLHGLGIGAVMSLFLVSWTFCFIAATVLYKWLSYEIKLRRAKLSPWQLLALIALFPTSFFLAIAYNESLFITLTVGSLYAYRRGNYWIASVLIILSCATRVQGGALAIFFVADYFLSRQRDHKKLIPVLLAPIGLLAYMWYLHLQFGNPFEFITAQHNWGRLSGNYIQNILSSIRPPYLWYIPVLLLGIWAVYKKLGLPWLAYIIVFFAIPLSSGRLDSLNRYMLACPVLFLGLTLWLKDQPKAWQILYLSSSIFLLAWNILLFFNDYWVA